MAPRKRVSINVNPCTRVSDINRKQKECLNVISIEYVLTDLPNHSQKD